MLTAARLFQNTTSPPVTSEPKAQTRRGYGGQFCLGLFGFINRGSAENRNFVEGNVLENNRLVQQDNLLESVLEVSNILKQHRPDLNTSMIPQLTTVQVLLTKDNLSNDDLEQIDKVIGYLCHFKCLYDFCPLELLNGETEQECWGRWYQILDRMKNRANLLCSSNKKRNKHK